MKQTIDYTFELRNSSIFAMRSIRRSAYICLSGWVKISYMEFIRRVGVLSDKLRKYGFSVCVGGVVYGFVSFSGSRRALNFYDPFSERFVYVSDFRQNDELGWLLKNALDAYSLYLD